MAAVAVKMTCNNPKNLFCFVCGSYTKSHHKRSIMTKPLVDAYEAYFKQRTAKRNYVHGPQSVCNDCNNALLRWANGLVSRVLLAFDVPMIWSEPRNHHSDCYFCLTRTGTSGKRMTNNLYEPVEYPNNLPSAHKPRMISPRASSNGMPATGTIPNRARSMGTITNGGTTAPNMKMPQIVHQGSIKQMPAIVGQAQPNNTRRVVKQVGPVLVAGMKRKSSELTNATTYDVKKVRLRSSEPSIVLEHSEKLLPTHSIYPATASTRVGAYQARPSVTTDGSGGSRPASSHPMITRVFSLQGEVPPYHELASERSALMRAVNGHIEMPITIEIEDDDDDDDNDNAGADDNDNAEADDNDDNQEYKVSVKQPKQESDNEHENIPQIEEEQHEQEQDTYTVQPKAEPPEDPTEEGPLEESNDQHVSPDARTVKMPLAAAPEFINIHSLPSSSSTASSKVVVVKMASPRKPTVTAQLPASTGSVTTSTAIHTNTGTRTLVRHRTVPEPVRQPHLITQSELILLLRDLELTREKSAILIDRLKRWNLLAAQLVNPSRARGNASAPSAVQPTTVVPVAQRVATMSTLNRLGAVTVKQGTRAPVVLTTPTVGQRQASQSFIRIAPAVVQSNTVTTSLNGKLRLADGVPVLRQQLEDGSRPAGNHELRSSS